jgi:hypothetical protein
MARRTIALFLLIATLAPPSEAAARAGEKSEDVTRPETGVEAAAEADQAPPAGSASDQALWRAGRAANESIAISRARAGTLQTRVRSNRLLERLEESAEQAGPRTARSLSELRERLLRAWRVDYEVLIRQWPVDPTRGCGYALLGFDSALRAPVGTEDDALALTVARGQLRECVNKATAAVTAMASANQALEAPMKEAEQALARRPGALAGDDDHEGPVDEKAEHEQGGEHGQPKKAGSRP